MCLLAQAQRLVGLGTIERTVGFAAEVSKMWPEARHKIDIHQAIDEYGEDAGIEPKIIRSDDEVEDRMAVEAAQARQQQQMAQAAAASDNAQKLASAASTGQGVAAQMAQAGLL